MTQLYKWIQCVSENYLNSCWLSQFSDFPNPIASRKSTCSFNAWKEEYEHMRTDEQNYTFNIRLNTSSTQETYSSVRFSTYTPIFVSSRIYRVYNNEKIWGLVTRYRHIFIHTHILAWAQLLPGDFSGRALANLLSAHCRSVSQQYIYGVTWRTWNYSANAWWQVLCDPIFWLLCYTAKSLQVYPSSFLSPHNSACSHWQQANFCRNDYLNNPRTLIFG